MYSVENRKGKKIFVGDIATARRIARQQRLVLVDTDGEPLEDYTHLAPPKAGYRGDDFLP